MVLMTKTYGTTPMAQEIQKKSTNSQIRFAQIHKYTQICTNTPQIVKNTYNQEDIAPWCL
jgi:hypothetical protein